MIPSKQSDDNAQLTPLDKGTIVAGAENIDNALTTIGQENLNTLSTLPSGDGLQRKHGSDMIALAQDDDGGFYIYRSGKTIPMTKETFHKFSQELDRLEAEGIPKIDTERCPTCNSVIPSGIPHVCPQQNVYAEMETEPTNKPWTHSQQIQDHNKTNLIP